MTRGKIVIFTNNQKIYSSIEFNGDMYYSDNGFGKIVLDKLPKIKSFEEYETFVKKFNDENYGYNEYEHLVYDLVEVRNNEFSYEDYLNMQDDYFGKWFSDYVYMKNLSNEPIKFLDREGYEVAIAPTGIAVFYFGRINVMSF